MSAARALSSDPVPVQASQATRVGTRRFDLGAGEGLGQVDLDGLADVVAGAGAPAAPPRRPPMKSPNIWSKMSPRPPPAEKSKPALNPPAAALLERRVAVAVVGGALLVVLQDVVGLVDFLELRLGLLVARIAVGVDTAWRACDRPSSGPPRPPPAPRPGWRSSPASPFQPFSAWRCQRRLAPAFDEARARHLMSCRPWTYQADFFFFSSTSSNSASTTLSSGLPPAPPPGRHRQPGPSHRLPARPAAPCTSPRRSSSPPG